MSIGERKRLDWTSQTCRLQMLRARKGQLNGTNDQQLPARMNPTAHNFLFEWLKTKLFSTLVICKP